MGLRRRDGAVLGFALRCTLVAAVLPTHACNPLACAPTSAPTDARPPARRADHPPAASRPPPPLGFLMMMGLSVGPGHVPPPHPPPRPSGTGYTWDGVVHKMSAEQWAAMLDVHCTAPFRLIQAAAPAMRDAGKAEAERSGRPKPRCGAAATRVLDCLCWC